MATFRQFLRELGDQQPKTDDMAEQLAYMQWKIQRVRKKDSRLLSDREAKISALLSIIEMLRIQLIRFTQHPTQGWVCCQPGEGQAHRKDCEVGTVLDSPEYSSEWMAGENPGG